MYMFVIRFEAFNFSLQEHYQIESLQDGARSLLVTQKATEELVSSMIAPLSESILIAVVRLIDDSMVEPKRKPTHYDIDFLVDRNGLAIADPKAQGQPVGKAKRVRAILSWAFDNDVSVGGRFIASLIANVQACGGFRSSSPNYVGEEAIKNAAQAFRSEGYELTADGELNPV
jgi:hypothetical protein